MWLGDEKQVDLQPRFSQIQLFFLPAVPTHLLPAGLASDMKNGAAFLSCVVTVDLN